MISVLSVIVLSINHRLNFDKGNSQRYLSYSHHFNSILRLIGMAVSDVSPNLHDFTTLVK